MALNWAGLRAQEVLKEYMQSNLDAKQHREEEYTATVKIQVSARRFLAYQLVRLWNRSAKEIQRFYRGHLGREYFRECRRRRDYELRMAYFNFHATYIQQIFRGYWSRKYICDYYARKAFISACVLAGKHMRTLCTMNYKLEIRGEQQEAMKTVNTEIDKFFSKNHHQCGTEVMKGAFYSPFVAIYQGGRSHLEEHIHDAHHKKVTGMELDKLDGFNEDGIPVKQLQNHYFVKSSKSSHSRMSMDTWRRVQEATRKNVTCGTYMTRLGIFESRYDHRRRMEKLRDLLIIHEKDFYSMTNKKDSWWKNMGPSMRCAEHYHLIQMHRKEAAIKELKDYPIMKEHPWTSIVPKGNLFETYIPFEKVFPKRHNHHHWPKYSLNRSMHSFHLPKP